MRELYRIQRLPFGATRSGNSEYYDIGARIGSLEMAISYAKMFGGLHWLIVKESSSLVVKSSDDEEG